MKFFNLKFINAILCLQLVACSKGVLNTSDDEGLTAQATSNDILVTNRTHEPVYLFMVERNTAARLDWIPGCAENNGLNPGESKYFAYENIFGYSENCEVIVYWWHCDSNSKPGLMNYIIIKAY